MSVLWQAVFSDSEGLVNSFLQLLPDMGTAAVAEVNGKIAGAAYAVTGMELVSASGKVQTCGYIYAVAVAPEFRGSGIGRTLTERSAELARDRGAEIICTLPAEESLYAWYKAILGTECVLHRQRFETEATAAAPVQSLSSSEYGQRREALLSDRCRMRPSHTTLEFQRRFCEELGGGLYACGGGICAAYLEDGAAVKGAYRARRDGRRRHRHVDRRMARHEARGMLPARARRGSRISRRYRARSHPTACGTSHLTDLPRKYFRERRKYFCI